jgi:hypothetical protein
MAWYRFLVANALGAILWATTMSLLGYFFGENWPVLEKWIGRTGVILLLLVLLVGLPMAWHRLRLPGALRAPKSAAAQRPESPSAPPPSNSGAPGASGPS